MVKQAMVAAALAAFLAVSPTHAANITNLWDLPDSGVDANYEADGFGTPDLTISVNGSLSGDSGSMAWGFNTDDPDDPTLMLINSIDNDSGFAWTQYTVKVTMNKAFTFLSTLLTPTVTTPGDWTINIFQPLGPDINGNYSGTLDLIGGTPVNPGDTLDYSYKVFFSGSTSYVITEEVSVVPEPGILGLVGIGSLGYLALARHRRRKI